MLKTESLQQLWEHGTEYLNFCVCGTPLQGEKGKKRGEGGVVHVDEQKPHKYYSNDDKIY